MAETKASGKLDERDLSAELIKQNLNEDKAQEMAHAGLFHDKRDTTQTLDEDIVDLDLMDLAYTQAYHDAAEDADDELDTDDEDNYEEVRPLNIKKSQTGNDGVQGMQ